MHKIIIMVTVLKRNSKKQSVLKLLEEMRRRSANKGLNAYKYCGIIKLVEDPVEIQRRLRNEW